MKRVFVLLFVISVGLLLGSVGCGGSGSSDSTPAPVITVAKRAFLLNQFSSVINVIDAAKDVLATAPISVSQPEILVVLSNKKSLVYSGSNGTLSIIDNPTQVITGLTTLSAPTESIVVTPDAHFAYAALPVLGKIAVVDLTAAANTAPTLIPADPATIPGVRRLVMTKNGNTILAFADNSDSISFVNTTSSNAVTSIAGFDRPFTAVVSGDDAKAYVLNCGKECGGTQAKVSAVDLTSKAVLNSANVAAATVGAADSSNLYVAGTDVTSNQGRFTVVSLSTLTPSATVQTISDGLHTTMGLGANNKIYVGSRACTNSAGKCLSVVDISKQPPVASVITGIPPSGTQAGNLAFGDVAAITPIKNRNVVYIIQNGVLQVYDTTTDLPQATPTILVTGKVVDVKEVD